MFRFVGNFTLIAVNCSLIALAAVGIWLTGSLWSLLACLFFMSSEAAKIDAECPSCHFKFVATKRDEC